MAQSFEILGSVIANLTNGCLVLHLQGTETSAKQTMRFNLGQFFLFRTRQFLLESLYLLCCPLFKVAF